MWWGRRFKKIAGALADAARRLMSPGSDWRFRRALVRVLDVLSESCAAEMAAQLPALASVVVAASRDPHPRVAHAAAHCLGHWAIELRSTAARVQSRPEVLRALLGCLGSGNLERVRAAAAFAVVNYAHASYCAREELGDVDALLNALGGVIVECGSTTVCAGRRVRA